MDPVKNILGLIPMKHKKHKDYGYCDDCGGSGQVKHLLTNKISDCPGCEGQGSWRKMRK